MKTEEQIREKLKELEHDYSSFSKAFSKEKEGSYKDFLERTLIGIRFAIDVLMEILS